MLQMLYKKIKKNFWMVLCLIIGASMAVSLVSSVPIYTKGILTRVLSTDLKKMQYEDKVFPGAYCITKNMENIKKDDIKESYDTINPVIESKIIPDIGLPVLSKKVIFKTADDLNIVNTHDDVVRNMRVEGISDFENHIEIINGKSLKDSSSESGVYNALISQRTAKNMDLYTGKTYELQCEDNPKLTKIKVVGIYKYKDENDPYWQLEDWEHSDSFIINFDDFNNKFIKNESFSLSEITWYTAFDYSKMNLNNVKAIKSAYEKQASLINDKYDAAASFLVSDKLDDYINKESKLQNILMIFQVPIIIMVIFYMIMISTLIIDRDKNEIAILKSRGADKKQILKIYLCESLFVSLIALIIGPPFGMFCCKVMGIPSGFLKFNDRLPITVSLTKTEYLYSIIILIIFIAAMMIPALNASKVSIVEYKQSKVRKSAKPLWQRFYLDIAFLLVSLYGMNNYFGRQNIVQITGVDSSSIPIDPIIYLIFSLFVLSLGMLFLRLYPHIINIIFHIGRKRWSPSSYISLNNVKRSDGKNQFIMIFLIFTISIGLFSISSAGTINNDLENNIKYMCGADVKLKSFWTPINAKTAESKKVPLIYVEPDYKIYKELKGVKSSCKVFSSKDGVININSRDIGKTFVMGINPYEFGKTAWFPQNLLYPSFNYYLNLLSQSKSNVLISNNLMESNDVKVGDLVYIKWGNSRMIPCVVAGSINYWPTFNPSEYLSSDFVVGNLDYFQYRMPLEPYEVWLKLKDANSLNLLYKDIKDKNLEFQYIDSMEDKITKEKSDPTLQGINGTLTLSFIATLIITAIGFLIYWILSIKARVLQFGILRAMGMSLKKLIKVLINEQILISGVSILMGFIIGNISVKIFSPLVNIMADKSEQILPSGIIPISNTESINMGIGILSMILIGLLILSRYVSKIKIDQALKLGED